MVGLSDGLLCWKDVVVKCNSWNDSVEFELARRTLSESFLRSKREENRMRALVELLGHRPTFSALRIVPTAVDDARANDDRAENAETDGEFVRETRI